MDGTLHLLTARTYPAIYPPYSLKRDNSFALTSEERERCFFQATTDPVIVDEWHQCLQALSEYLV